MTTRTASPLRCKNLTLLEARIAFVTEDCGQCNVLFAMESTFRNEKLADKTTFYCPNGHSMSFTGKSTEQQLRERAEQAEQRVTWANSRAEAQRREREIAQRSAAAYRGHLTRMKNRIANGVCPVQGCKRSFEDVRRHITDQHAEWAGEHPEALVAAQEGSGA